MSYKTISAHIGRPDGVSSIMNVAVPLAASFDAHLIGLHVFANVPVSGTIGAQVPADIIQQYVDFMRKDAKAIEAGFLKFVKGKDVRSEWRGAETKIAGVDMLKAITAQCRSSDLVVIGQADGEQRVGDLTTDIILSSGRPVMIVPEKGMFGKISGRIVVGWDGSREAARAVFDSLPLLKRAKAVSIVTVGKGSDVKDAVRGGGVDLAETLARHAVNAEIVMLEKNDKSAGEALLGYISEQDGELLVMGCYSHSRLRERLFGGATRHLLKNMISPVLMSH